MAKWCLASQAGVVVGAVVTGRCAVFPVDYGDLRVMPGLGARLAAGGGVRALRDALETPDGAGVNGDVPLDAHAGV